MPKGVPYRVQVLGKGTRTYTFTEIADGTGFSVANVSLVLRQLRPITPYFQTRLAAFFGVREGESCTIDVSTPPVRRVGRPIGRIRRGSVARYGRPV